MRSRHGRAARFALAQITPILFEFVFVGLAAGILLHQAGYGPVWAFVSALFIYAGSMQIVMVPFMQAGMPLYALAAMTFFINARHMFYGIGFVDRFRRMGPVRYVYMALTVTDETYSVLCSRQCPAEVEPDLADFYINFMAHMCWVASCTLGAVTGELLPVDMAGIEFSATAFFITVVLNQWKQLPSHIPALTGLVSALLFYFLLGPDNFILPALAASMVALMLLRDRIEKERTEHA